MGVAIESEIIQHPFVRDDHAIPTDVEGMVGLYERIVEQRKQLQIVEQDIRYAIASMSTSEAKTSRVMTDNLVVKVVQPDPWWAQKDLKELWSCWNRADEFLRIDRIAPQLREVKKLENMTGDDEFMRAKAKLLAARTPSTNAPSITVERRKEG